MIFVRNSGTYWASRRHEMPSTFFKTAQFVNGWWLLLFLHQRGGVAYFRKRKRIDSKKQMPENGYSGYFPYLCEQKKST